jgi:hypothetical protein
MHPDPLPEISFEATNLHIKCARQILRMPALMKYVQILLQYLFFIAQENFRKIIVLNQVSWLNLFGISSLENVHHFSDLEFN